MMIPTIGMRKTRGMQGVLKAVMLILWVIGLEAVEVGQAPINYWSGEAGDRFAVLMGEVERGEKRFEGETDRENLEELLRYLEIPVESQVMVYSKTSAQLSRISPSRPRAVYFSDDCYVGWVQGGAVEVLAYDREKGGIFYLLEFRNGGEGIGNSGKLVDVSRPQTCLNCHMRSVTRHVPGGLVRSVFPDRDGMPHFGLGTFFVDEATPLGDRWGGWYVTGDPGEHKHMGNRITLEDKSTREVSHESLVEGNSVIDSLDGYIRTSVYPGGGSSDIVALMVLEHQVRMHNVLTYANLMVRQTEYRSREFYKSLGEAIPDSPEGTLQKVIAHQSREVVRHLFFHDEVELLDFGIEGGEHFANAFLINRSTTSDNRSLKDFRLFERLFKYRCSYVIYSEVFDFLPEILKTEVYRLMYESLDPSKDSPLTNHMSSSEKKRILSILSETKSDLPDYWKAGNE